MPVRDDNIGINEVIESRKPSSKRNVQKDKRNKKRGKGKGKGTSGTSRRYEITGNIITLQAGQDNPVNSLTSDLVGATLVVSNPHTLVVSDLYSTELGFTLPTTYSTTISKVINSKTFEVSEPYYVTDKRGKKFPARLKAGSVTITYDTFKTETEDTIYQRSYANLTIGNLRTFSGDVYKAKIYYRPSLPQTDFEEIYDTFVVPENVLVDSTSINQYENIGFFHTGSIVANNWVSSSTSTETSPFVTLNNDKLIDGIQISGSVKDLEDKVTFRTKNSFDLEQSVDYVVRFNSYYFKALSEVRDSNDSVSTTNRASLKVFVSGSALTGANGEADFFLGEVDIPNNSADEGEIPDIIGRFKSSGTGSPKAWLKFELNSGRFIVQDVSVEPFSETNFNPSFFKVLVPMPIPQGKRVDKYDFLVEFYDSNNNLAETTAQVNGVQFRGPRQVIADGLDAVLSGSMLMGESIEIYGSNPAYLRSVGYNGFDKTIAGTGDRNGGFLIWSGSIGSGASLNRLTSSEAYNGVGLEIVDASGSNTYNHSFFQFASNYRNTGNSRFRVQTNEFLLGVSGSGQSESFISGSDGNLRISSSGFFLDTDGSINAGKGNFTVSSGGTVTLAGTITAAAGGTIGGFTIGTNDISIGNSSGDDNYISIDSSNRKFRIGQKTSLTDNKTGVHVGTDGIALGASSVFKVTNAGAVTAGNITATGGTIGGFTIDEDEIKAGSTLVLDADTNSGQIKLGGATSITAGSDGVYMDGTGDFRVGDADGHRISFDGTDLFMSSSKFFLGSKADGQSFISASNGELEISSSFFHVSKSGFITGSRVKFTGGVVGGWTLSDTTLTGGSVTLNSAGSIEVGGLSDATTTATTAAGFFADNNGNVLIKGNTNDNDYIKFNVSSTPKLDIKTQTFKLDTTNLDIDSTAKRIQIFDDQSPQRERIRIGTVDGTSDAIYGMKVFDGTGAAADGTKIVEFSNNENSIAGWDISTSTISKNNLIISSEGFIASDGFATNTQGFFLGMRPLFESDGTAAGTQAFLEVDEANIRGTLRTTVFEKERVSAVGGQLHIANSTTITGSEQVPATSANTRIQVANSSGFTDGEFLIAKKFNSTGFTTEIMKVISVQHQDAGHATNRSGSILVSRQEGTSLSSPDVIGDSDSGVDHETLLLGETGDTGATAQTYNPGQVLVSTGKENSGYIRLNANPNDDTTPYIDIIERDGPKVYDTELKVRLGDLSGITDTINGQSVSGFGLYTDNAFLKGGIVASYGSIGGFNMSANDLWSGNSTLGHANTKIVIGNTDGTPKIALGPGSAGADSLTATGGGTGIYMDSSNNGIFRVGNPSAEQMYWDGSNLNVTGQITINNASAVKTQLDIDDLEAKVVITGDSVKVQHNANNFAELSGSGMSVHENGDKIAQFSSTTRIGKKTDNRIEITDTTFKLFEGTSNERINIDGNGVQIKEDANNLAEVSASGMSVFAGGNKVGQFASITQIGNKSTEHIEISGSGLSLKDGTTQIIGISAGGVRIGQSGQIKLAASTGNATFSGTLSAPVGNIAGWTINGNRLDSVNDNVILDGTGDGSIKLGSSAASITETANTGIFMDGTGDFRVGTATSGDNYLHFDQNNTSLTIKAGTFDLEATSTTTVNSKSHTAGIVMDSSTALIQVSSQSAAIVGGEVSESKVTINGSGHIVVSQSSVPIFESGREFIFTSIQDMVVNSLPQETITKVEDGETFEGQVASQSPQQGSTAGADTITIGGVETGIPSTRMSSAVIDNHVSASRIGAGSSFFLRNKNPNSSENTKFRVFIQDDAATSKAVGSQPVQAGFDFRKTIEDGQFTNSHALGQAMVFSNYVSSKDADSRYVANGNTTGSAIYHFQNILDQGSSGKWADAKFALMRLDADVQSIDTARNDEFVFLEARSSRTAATENKVVFQVQYDGEVVSSANITAFGTAFMNVSDKRLKENIYDVSGSLNKILQLRPTHFTWKENQKDDVGFIAQEVEEIIPEVVEVSNGFIDVDGTEENKIKDMKAVSYPKLVPYLVDTIQVLNKRIEELEKKVK